MSTMIRPIFWTGSADCISEYLVHNRRLQEISTRFPLYILYSGSIDYLRMYYPRAILIECTNDWKMKAILSHEAIRLRSDYDVVIRFCPDAIIKNVDGLLDSVKDGMNGDYRVAVGNVAEFNGVTYLRGGCNSTPRLVFEKLMLKPSDRDYDTWYSLAIIAAGGIMKDRHLFEINNKYTGKFPVWHPTQYDNGHRDMNVRFKTFLSEC